MKPPVTAIMKSTVYLSYSISFFLYVIVVIHIFSATVAGDIHHEFCKARYKPTPAGKKEVVGGRGAKILVCARIFVLHRSTSLRLCPLSP
jgi:hypothetical protein